MGLTDGSVVKKPPAVQETQVWFLDQEDPLQEEMQPIPLLLPGKSSGQRSLAVYSSYGGKRVGEDLATNNNT